MSSRFLATGKFKASDIREMRDKAQKPRALYEIGQQLRKRRQAARLDRAAVAAQCAVAADQLGRFEHGASDIGFAALAKYCALVSLDVEALLLPHMGDDAQAVRAVVELARSWTGEGKALPIAEVIGA